MDKQIAEQLAHVLRSEYSSKRYTADVSPLGDGAWVVWLWDSRELNSRCYTAPGQSIDVASACDLLD